MVKIPGSAFKALLVLLWLAVFLKFSTDPIHVLSEYGAFAFLGVVGAIFANATGAGGGVIFVPFFSQLGLDNNTIVATSFAIQCFGMTAGALSWFTWYKQQQYASDKNITQDSANQHKQAVRQWHHLPDILCFTVPFSIVGIVLVQYSDWQSPSSLHMTFGAFSVILALAIFASIPLLKNTQFESELVLLDKICLPVIALVGGGITAWLSVGVGELVAIYLIFRRFNVSFSIACAVMLTAFSVWAGVLYHLIETGVIYWQIILFAGPGAIIGGRVAKRLVLHFSVTRLKLFFAAWVLLIGLASIPL